MAGVYHQSKITTTAPQDGKILAQGQFGEIVWSIEDGGKETSQRNKKML